jgi:stalled ribosome rescue protein Dom34
VDSRRARLLSYRGGLLEPIRELDADTDILDLSDIGMSKRAATASGVRGETRTDAGKDALDEIANRLRDRVAEILVDLAGSDGTVLVGGAKKAAASMMRVLAPKLTGRLMDLSDVPVAADGATLVREVELAASAVTSRRQFELLDQARGTSGLGALGWNDTLSALRGGAVDTLLLSRELIAMAPDDTEDLVRLALAHRADVEELGGDIGTELHESAGGVAARLRFRAIR